MKQEWYIVQKSNWQGDAWRPVAGPMSKSEANTQKSNFEYHPHRATGGIDIQSEKHAKVVSRTWLARHGYPRTGEGRLRLAEDIFYYEEDVRQASQPRRWPEVDRLRR